MVPIDITGNEGAKKNFMFITFKSLYYLSKINWCYRKYEFFIMFFNFLKNFFV